MISIPWLKFLPSVHLGPDFNLKKTIMKHLIKSTILLIVCLMIFETEGNAIRPFRVLVVIGDQWEDPASYMVKPPPANR